MELWFTVFIGGGLNVAELITAVASAALVLGGLLAWILSNERRISSLERSQEDTEKAVNRIEGAIDALHQRLDGYFHRKGPRADS